jgi:Late exocytosis, associated with Golgi transport
MAVLLAQIGVTALAGVLVHSFCIFFFGIALIRRSTHIAPRCQARPRNVIYNPNPSHLSQDRGNPFWGWIPWVLRLSYEDLLKGVPGTGTREGGLAGSMLHVNLDDIVMLRFHSFGLRVTTLGLFIYTLILLPLYWTAIYCSGADGNNLDTTSMSCSNLTDYDRTTLASIVPEASNGQFKLAELSLRLYAAVLCSWIVTCYACVELRQEWRDILAMRRFHYLERDHWRSQNQEENDVRSIRPQQGSTDGNESNYLHDRDPWIPNPEYRDTPPSIALWSVLVGGVPSKPKSQPGDQDMEPDNQNSNREWQLAVTSAFFDHCIPNQPGFSSSVAAVTILPDAAELAAAWRKWYAAASKLRRLRFIRKQLRARRHYDIEVHPEGSEPGEDVALSKPPSALPSSIDPATRCTSNDPEDDMTLYRKILGSAMDEEVEELFLSALAFGPEQTAAYSREFAQSAAPCCPNGCFEGGVIEARIDELEELEEIALEEVEAANGALERARQKAVMDAGSDKEADDSTLKDEAEDSMSKEAKKGIKTQSKKGMKGVLQGSPLDLNVIKKIVNNDTIRNLMGKDDSVTTEMRQGSDYHLQKKDNDVLEERLWKQKNNEQGPSQSMNEIEEEIKEENTVSLFRSSGPIGIRRPSMHTDDSGRHNDGQSVFVPELGVTSPAFDTSEQEDTDYHMHVDESAKLSQRQQASAAAIPSRVSKVTALSNHTGLSIARSGELTGLHTTTIHTEKTTKASVTGSPCLEERSKHKLLATEGSYQNLASISFPPRHAHNFDPLDAWAVVGALAMNSEYSPVETDEDGERPNPNGTWELSSFAELSKTLLSGLSTFSRWTTAKSSQVVNEAVDIVAASSTYAIVTFTSRQAAVAARTVLADGRGTNRWTQVSNLPIPPLADAAACDPITCRGCCRPVTLSINDSQKKWRCFL